ncbi:MAG TPA: M1 family aminopeptidase, partial [Pyrinomonadaceae bacterium]
MSLTPPVENERHSLALFTGQPSLTEQFTKLTLRFTDKTYEEIKASPAAEMRANGAQASRARDIYRDHQSLTRKTLRTNLELRTLVDLYATERPGFFNVFVGGKRFEKLIFQLDPRGIPEVSPEEVLLMSYGESDRGYWTAFHLAEEHRTGKASNSEDHRLFDITHHDIEAEIRGTKLTATDRLTLRPLASGLRVLPFDFYPTLRVLGVRDEAGRELQFVQENKDEDADFGVIWPEALEAGKSYKVSIEYRGGDAIADAGQGNFFLLPPARSTWYPNNGGTQFGDRALFNVTFRYPKNHLFIGTGTLLEPEAREGDTVVAKWSSGQTELAVAGFNYGKFKKKEVLDKDTGYNVEFYANTEMPDFMRGAGIGSMSTLGGADTALTDTQNATRIYTHFFGKLPYTRLAMSQQPAGGFGQAWPTLIYMPFTAFLDSTQRWSIMGAGNAGNNFWRYVGPHEVAHQWWGHLIGWTSYRDQWMSEGFAEFSTSLYVQHVRKDLGKFIDFWNDQRELITQAGIGTNGRRPYMVGPVTQGYRLNSGKTGNVARSMIYPKGAYILHMLRMMMYDVKGGTGDKRFTTMMQDFIKTHYNRDVSTEDLKRSVEKHMTAQMNLDGNGRMDWFFDAWVYGTDMPSYKFDYQLAGDMLSGRITQSGVGDKFAMLVPIYADFGKGWQKLGAVTLVGNTTFDLPNIKLPQPAKRAA